MFLFSHYMIRTQTSDIGGTNYLSQQAGHILNFNNKITLIFFFFLEESGFCVYKNLNNVFI